MPIVAADDGLALPEVGPWSKRKYHFLSRYISAFTVAMRNKWPELHYIDLFAGAGFARIRDTSEIVLGSPMLAAATLTPFTRIHVCERDAANLKALKTRLGRAQLTNPARIVPGDANAVIHDLVAQVPQQGALCLTFADPFGLHLDFATVEVIANLNGDLVLLFADNMDALRNWAAYYKSNPQSNLDRFMGEGGWRDLLEKSPSDQAADKLKKRYEQQLRARCGYKHFAYQRVRNSHDRDIYTLVYATKHKIGITIWNKVSGIDEKGQRSFIFPED
ncbi:MAG: three-Cys-motif partner protein TcmP [Phycisphaeraceae bacterium]|nr:three-Cys-motif partner protein TcmP [Phycisphaeraceae bacterium]